MASVTTTVLQAKRMAAQYMDTAEHNALQLNYVPKEVACRLKMIASRACEPLPNSCNKQVPGTSIRLCL
jgi:hypothetical protein